MNTKHTPGPWETTTRTDRRSRIEVRTSEISPGAVKGRLIATVANISFGVDAANAELLAASPDLLAALREICDNTGKTHHKPAGQPSREVYVVSVELIAAARAAIARAEGKQ